MSRKIEILVLPGDGIGPEVMSQALRVLHKISDMADLSLVIHEDLIHGQAWDAYGTFCRDETVHQAKNVDAVLVGAVGGEKWGNLAPGGTPEEKDGLMRLRKELDVFAGIRPARSYSHLNEKTPYRPELLDEVDLIVLREMCGGVMFASPRGIESDSKGPKRGFDTAAYDVNEIKRHARFGFELARKRRGHLTSVDKANVMESGAFWREIVSEVSFEYPDVHFQNMYADNCSYQLAINPKQFDVILADNLFGDILSDQAAALSGSLGMLASASLTNQSNSPGIYEPVHGTAPDIAGKNIANPIGMILSLALMFEFGFSMQEISEKLHLAVEEVTRTGPLTPDLGGLGTTNEVTEAILRELERNS